MTKVRLPGTAPESAEDERDAFLGIACHMMKRLLIRHAGPLYRRAEHVDISDEIVPTGVQSDSFRDGEDALVARCGREPGCQGR